MKSKSLNLYLVVSLLSCIWTFQVGAKDDDLLDIKLSVSVRSLGSSTKGDTRESQRALKILIDNREDLEITDAVLEWQAAGRDISTRKITMLGTGKEKVSLESRDKSEVITKGFTLSKKDGKRAKNNKNGKNNGKNNRGATKDSGTRYAGYYVVLKHDGKVIAKAVSPALR